MNQYLSSAELKAAAKEHMFGKYGTAIAALVIVFLIEGFCTLLISFLTDTTTIPGTVVYYLLSFIVAVIFGIFSSGTAYFYLKAACGYPVSVSDIFYGFKLCPDKALIIQAWTGILSYLFMLPNIVLTYQFTKATAGGNIDISTYSSLMLPYSLSMILMSVASIIISLFYAQSFYLLHDFPQYSARELLAMSRHIMKGQKGRLFYLYISFLPLFLLSLLSCGIAFLWLMPYINATLAEFFLDIMRKGNTH